jgi:hypothetical protein
MAEVPQAGAAMRLPIAIFACSLLGIAVAVAGVGSTTLDDIIDQLQDEQALIAEILAELKTQNIKTEDVNCAAGRFDDDWRNLAGARTVPFECQVGKRKLSIQGKLHVYDDNGTELDLNAKASRETGIEFKQADITWKWQ